MTNQTPTANTSTSEVTAQGTLRLLEMSDCADSLLVSTVDSQIVKEIPAADMSSVAASAQGKLMFGTEQTQ